MKKGTLKKIIQNLLLLIPFISYPDYILSGIFRNIFHIYSFLIFIYIYLSYLKKNNGKISRLIILGFIMQLVPLIATIIYKNNSEIMMAFKVLSSTIAILMLIEYKIKEDSKMLLKSLYIFFGVAVFINIMTFYIYYPGMYGKNSFYFLGNDNGSIYESLTLFTIGMIYYDSFNKKETIPKLFLLFMLFIATGYFFVNSGNGKVCMIMLILFALTYKKDIYKKMKNYKLLVIAYAILFAFVVIFRSQNGLIPVILKILGKDPTYTGRTFIWDYCFKYINIHPLIGNGYEPDILLMMKMHQVKAHNLIVQYLYMGGIGMIIPFVTMLLNSMQKSARSINNAGIIINFVLVIFLIISMFDYYYAKSNLFILIGLAYNCRYIKKAGDTNG